ncbi:MAG: hypothetical protein ACRDYC_00485 [Acidimicrobiales bacterium]
MQNRSIHTSHLEQARLASDGQGRLRPAPLLAGVIPPPGAQVDPDVAAWQEAQGAKLDAWRHKVALQLLGEATQPPPWAAELGEVPSDPERRQGWANALSHVALYRVTHGVTGTDLLGPKVEVGSAEGAAYSRARLALTIAAELAGDPDSASRLRPQAPTTPSRERPTIGRSGPALDDRRQHRRL